MKKIYLLSGAIFFSVTGFSQTISENGKAIQLSSKSISHSINMERTITNPDTTGIVNITDFLPAFASVSNQATIYGYTGGGFIFGNNVSTNSLKICAQGYQNLNSTPVKIIGAMLWFGAKQRDLAGSATSKVVVSAWDMAANKAYNTNGSGTFNSSTLNSPGPTGTAKSSADLLFTAIDTTSLSNANYVTFSTPMVFAADFAIVMDVTSLAAGDTVGLVSDQVGDAVNLDYAFHKIGTKWFVTDQLFSPAATPDFGSGALDLDIAMFAVLSDNTGVNEYFNGMKLTTYPNPSVEKTVVEYTLEKNSGNVGLTVYDQSGRKVFEKNYGSEAAGTYKIDIETASLNAGTYLYQLRANGRNFTKQLVVTK